MSLLLAGTRFLLRFVPASTASVESLHGSIAKRGDAAAAIPARLHRVATVTESTIQGRRVVRLEPKRTGGSAAGRELLYTHGGAYVYPILTTHWNLLAGLIAATGVSVTVPLYGLAPEYKAVDAFDLLDEVYAGLVASGAPVFLAGDSAGGGLALAQAQRYRDRGVAAPAAVILISPWVDLGLTNPGVQPVAHLDHMLGAPGLIEAGELWRGTLSTRDPLVSPLFGDLAGLPPVYTFQGDRDILLADTKDLTRRILVAGGRAELRITHGGFHVFVGAPWTSEARRALRRIAGVLGGDVSR